MVEKRIFVILGMHIVAILFGKLFYEMGLARAPFPMELVFFDLGLMFVFIMLLAIILLFYRPLKEKLIVNLALSASFVTYHTTIFLLNYDVVKNYFLIFLKTSLRNIIIIYVSALIINILFESVYSLFTAKYGRKK